MDLENENNRKQITNEESIVLIKLSNRFYFIILTPKDILHSVYTQTSERGIIV